MTGELREIDSGVFAYVQPDGSWFVNNTGFIAGPDGVLAIDSCATEARTRAYLAAADAPHQHPRFWAPFVVLGNGDVRGAPGAVMAMPSAAGGMVGALGR